MTERKCETCVYFNAGGEQCFRYPRPAPVMAAHWCGEHKGKPGRPKKPASERSK